MLTLIKADRYGYKVLEENESLEILLDRKYRKEAKTKNSLLLVIDPEEIKGKETLLDKLYNACPNPLESDKKLSFCLMG